MREFGVCKAKQTRLRSGRIALLKEGFVKSSVVFASLLGLSGISWAISPTQGIVQPDSDRATGFGLSAFEDNPAGLGFGHAFELSYSYAGTQDDQLHEGHALQLGFGLFENSYHTALGLQFLESPVKDTGPIWKFSLGQAIALSESLSWGFNWHRLSGATSLGYHKLSSFDLGFLARPAQWLALGAAVTDLNNPDSQKSWKESTALRRELHLGTTARRAYQLGLGFKPFEDRLMLHLSARLPEKGDEHNSYGATLQLRLYKGLALTARYELQLDVVENEGRNNHALMVGLMDTGRFGAGLFGFFPSLAESGAKKGLYATARYRSGGPVWHFDDPVEVVEFPILEASELEAPGFLESDYHPHFLNLVLDLQAIAQRDNVKLVVMGLADLDLSWGQVEELRDAILALQQRGKRVYAYLPSADSKLYAVAVAADRIYMPPTANLQLTGVRQQHFYIAELLQKLGIRAEFIAIGDYKSAPEMFTQTEPSKAAREVDKALLDGVYGRLLDAIAQSRPISRSEAADLIDRGPYSALSAQKARLIDEVIQYDHFEQIVKDEYGRNFQFISWPRRYEPDDERWGRVPRVGLLYAVGNILDGETDPHPLSGSLNTGSQNFIRAARQLAGDSSVKAVVLRIDSPGGSVSASDLMWNELSQLAQKKPLIVSMGGTAASGGYYIASAGHEIYAEPSTITGSIGIFAGKFDVSGLLQKLGVSISTEDRGAQAGVMSSLQGWSENEKTALRQMLEENYQLFLERVQHGRRNLTLEKIRELAGGRVWSGQEAYDRGLVDHLGGLSQAIRAAADKAHLKSGDYKVELYGFDEDLNLLPNVMKSILPNAHSARTAELSLQKMLQGLGPLFPLLAAVQPLLALPQSRPLALLPLVQISLYE